MGNALVGYGVGAVAATLALAYVVSLVASVPFGLTLVGTVTFGVIVLSASVTAGTGVRSSDGTTLRPDASVLANRRATTEDRFTAVIYGLGLVVVSSSLLVLLA